MRKAFIDITRHELKQREDLIVLLGDISVAGFFGEKEQLLPGVHNCGILEQAMLSFGAGASHEGLYPIMQTIIPFIVERAFEQIKLDFCAQNNKGLLVGVGGGLEYSKLGYTHQTLWDTSLLSNLEEIIICTPTLGPEEVKKTISYFIENKKLAYLRLTKDYLQTNKLTENLPGFEVEKIVKIKSTSDIDNKKAVIFCGSFPGIDEMLYSMECDVFSYSCPNLIPDNVDILSGYSELEIREFGTSSILARTFIKAGIKKSIKSYIQSPKFFRDYGDDAAKSFIMNNWTCEIISPNN